MKSSPEDNDTHRIAPTKLRCEWMTAGILSYQLCDRQFDCDKCPLDAAMRMHFLDKIEQPTFTPEREQPSRPTLLFEHYDYSRNHCWAKSMMDNVVRVGIEPGFASLLLSPKAIVLPAIGDLIKNSQTCCWIVTDGGTIPLQSPVSGTVSATNAQLSETPHELCSNPFTNGWLFQMQRSSKGNKAAHLLKKQDAEIIFAKDIVRFDTLVRDTLKNNNMSIGLTLADGGEAVHDISTMLGARRYVELLREVFG